MTREEWVDQFARKIDAIERQLSKRPTWDDVTALIDSAFPALPAGVSRDWRSVIDRIAASRSVATPDCPDCGVELSGLCPHEIPGVGGKTVKSRRMKPEAKP